MIKVLHTAFLAALTACLMLPAVAGTPAQRDALAGQARCVYVLAELTTWTRLIDHIGSCNRLANWAHEFNRR